MDEILASLNTEAAAFDGAGLGGVFDLDPALFDSGAAAAAAPLQPAAALSPTAPQAPFVDYLDAPASPEYPAVDALLGPDFAADADEPANPAAPDKPVTPQPPSTPASQPPAPRQQQQLEQPIHHPHGQSPVVAPGPAAAAAATQSQAPSQTPNADNGRAARTPPDASAPALTPTHADAAAAAAAAANARPPAQSPPPYQASPLNGCYDAVTPTPAPAPAPASASQALLSPAIFPPSPSPSASPPPAPSTAAASTPGQPPATPGVASDVVMSTAAAAAATTPESSKRQKLSAAQPTQQQQPAKSLALPGMPPASAPAAEVAAALAAALPPPPVSSPPSQADGARRRLRPAADKVVFASWKAAVSPTAFVASARAALRAAATGRKRNADGELTTAKGAGVPQWQLDPPAEGALLDALFARITSAEAASTRLLMYVRQALVFGLVSQRAVLEACVEPCAEMSERVQFALAKLLADILPHYMFTADDDGIGAEADRFLAAFALVLSQGARSPSVMPVVASLLAGDRVIALVRAAARRQPSNRAPVYEMLERMEASQTSATAKAKAMVGAAAILATGTDMLADLKTGLGRLRNGLGHGITTFQSIAELMGRPKSVRPGAPIMNALSCAMEITALVFGPEVGQAMRTLWASRESPAGDLALLHRIALAAHQSSTTEQFARYGLRDRIRACEAIVRYLAECASVPGVTEQWLVPWGGRERLGRMIRDVLPQLKSELRSEFSCLMVSTAVVGTAVLCLGDALQLDEPNNGAPISAKETERKAELDDIVEESLMELTGFAVNCLEDAAVADEMPAWRSLGVWLLLLASRCGCMLRASRCNHLRAANVLGAWGGSPSTTAPLPPSSSSHGGAALQGAHASGAVGGAPGAGGGGGGSGSRGGGRARSGAAPGGSGGPGGSAAPAGGAASGGGSGNGSGGRGGADPNASGAAGGRGGSAAAGGGGGQHGHHGHVGSTAPGSAAQEGVSSFAVSTALAVLDASDVRGDNETIRALCTYQTH